MSRVTEWAIKVHEFAESKRRTVAFGPEHPAVRAAKRYCQQTGASWEIGIGGRCELGKRALKQWWGQIRSSVTARWAIIVTIALLAIAAGLIASPSVTLTLLAVFAAYAYFGGGVFLGLYFEDRKNVRKRSLIGLFILTILISGIVFVVARLMHFRVFQIILLALICGAGLLGLYALMMHVGIASFMLVLIIVVAIVAGAFGVAKGIDALGRYVARTGLEHAAAAKHIRLSDADLQRAARDELDGLLRAYYAAQTDYELNGMSYEQWLDNFEKVLQSEGTGWTELVCEHPYGSLPSLHSYPALLFGYTDFMQGLKDIWRDRRVSQAAARKQHTPWQVVSFIASALFLLKSSVCPNVILPKWEDVQV